MSATTWAPMAGLAPVGSMFTGYGGLDLAVLAAFPGTQLAWCADPTRTSPRS